MAQDYFSKYFLPKKKFSAKNNSKNNLVPYDRQKVLNTKKTIFNLPKYFMQENALNLQSATTFQKIIIVTIFHATCFSNCKIFFVLNSHNLKNQISVEINLVPHVRTSSKNKFQSKINFSYFSFPIFFHFSYF